MKSLSSARRNDLQGPVLILGAGCALALALASRLERQGIPVCGVCRTVPGLKAARQNGTTCLPLESPEDISLLCERMLGAPPAAYVDAMHSRFESLLAQAAPERLDRWATEDIGLRARCLRAVTRSMLARRRGRCLFLSSTAAERPAPGQAFYAAAKLAGESLFRSIGLELAGRGVTACILRLGLVDSGRGRDFLEKRPDARIREIFPTGRTISEEEAVSAMLFLLNPENSAVNASVMTLDGGFSAVKPLL